MFLERKWEASEDLLQNEKRKYDILFLGETWQYTDNFDNLHYPIWYFDDFVYEKILTKKSASPGLYLLITAVSRKERFQSMIRHQKILFGLRQTKA